MDAGPQPGGKWVASNATLMLLVRGAYQGFPLPGQVIDGPAWINIDRYDISAKAEGAPSPDEMRGFVRQLLADRFKLRVHVESREMDVYALVLARPDGRLGSRIKPSSSDCDALHAARLRGELPSTPLPRLEPGQRPECGMMSMLGNNVQRVSGGGMKMSNVASVLQQPVGQPVIDRTGLTELFDFDLEFAREGVPQPGAADPSSAPVIFTAVQEQLGLKLERRKESVDVLVIDHVERPTEN